MTSAVIVSTARTPLAKSWKGSFNMTHGATLGGHAVQHAVQRAGIDPATATPEQLRGNTAPRRSLPIASLDMGLFFDRETTVDGDAYLHTLEPRLFYLNTPYRDQRDLPLFDTRAFTFSWGQLFRDSRFTGADRQNDANQLTAALTTRLIRQADGREKLSASIG